MNNKDKAIMLIGYSIIVAMLLVVTIALTPLLGAAFGLPIIAAILIVTIPQFVEMVTEW